MRRGFVAAMATLVVLALGAAASAIAGSSSATRAAAVTPDCRSAGVGIASIFSGPAAALGQDQLRWSRVFVQFWNANKPVPGVSKSFKRTKIRIRAVGDSALDPQKAATIAGQMISNKKVLALSGFAGSNENLGGGPVLDRGGMAYVSSSATRDDLASNVKNF